MTFPRFSSFPLFPFFFSSKIKGENLFSDGGAKREKERKKRNGTKIFSLVNFAKKRQETGRRNVETKKNGKRKNMEGRKKERGGGRVKSTR